MILRSGHRALLFIGLIGVITGVLQVMTKANILLCFSVTVLIAMLACVMDEG